MKKKIVSVLLVAAMAVSMFTGCEARATAKNLTANLARRH